MLRFNPFFEFFSVGKIHTKHFIVGVHVSRDCNKFIIYRAFHAVFVRDPFSETIKKFPSFVIRIMIDVSTILRHQDTVFVNEVIGISTDMVALVNYNNTLTIFGVFSSQCCSRQSCTYDNYWFFHGFSLLGVMI
ncbi:hypothetical protein D3C86_1780190 [compost metagenome]